MTLEWSEHGDIARLVPSPDATVEEKHFIEKWVAAWEGDHGSCLKASGLAERRRQRAEFARR